MGTLLSHLKEESLDRIKWRNQFGRGCGPVVWQITDEWMNVFPKRVPLMRYDHNTSSELCVLDN
jgi:hypothetical protein